MKTLMGAVNVQMNERADARAAARADARAEAQVADDPGFLSEADSRAIFERCAALAEGHTVRVAIRSVSEGGVRWARNRAFLSETRQLVTLDVALSRRGQNGASLTSRIDDEGLQDAVAAARRMLEFKTTDRAFDERSEPPPPVLPMSRPTLWSDATVAFNGAQRDDIARHCIDAAETAGMMSSGDLSVATGSSSVWNTNGVSRYYATTRVNFSTTVRDAKGTGAGWAGIDDFDVSRVDFKAFARRALEKGVASRNPVAVEPGRYTTILEPQAVADLWKPLVNPSLMRRSESEDPDAEPFLPFNKGGGRSKMGDRVIDPRLTISSDPMDPQGGFIPFTGGSVMDGLPYQAVNWIDRGVLRELEYEWFWALSNLGREQGIYLPWSYRISGGTTSIDEMIATTKRGMLVTRFHNIRVTHPKSVTCTGFTRDGVWLIENGKITKPVKNFRFTESPLLIFNRVEQLGVPQRVFSSRFSPNDSVNDGENARIAPAMKVQDFNFTQLADAV